MALHCLYTTSSFEEALVKIINYAGDSDTTGAVCG
jgi:ADP-ribosylglycohydrolase